MRTLLIIAPLLMLLAIMSSCNRDNFTTNPADKLSFSTDTVQFDTIFTSIGSTTKYLRVINTHSKSIKVDDIRLARGSNSVFRVNIDGVQSTHVRNVEIAAGDSIFIFVEVTINPTQNDMIEQDSIVFSSNGNVQDVDLVAFGQNVFLVDGKTISNDTTWTMDKPILVYNSALVDENVELRIDAGTQLHFHYGSSLLVKGTLKVNGELGSPVVFQGDRLESDYDDVSGQWGAWLTLDGGGIYLLGGIHFLTGSKYNEINYAEVKNAIVGIRADSVVTSGVPTVRINNTIVQHMNVAGLFGAGAHIESSNSVYSDCGQYTAAMLYGGLYDFKHCTFANYYSGARQSSSVFINNFFQYQNDNGEGVIEVRPIIANFSNCILYGNLAEELNIDLHEDGISNYNFKNCLLKTERDITTSNFINSIKNQDPKFIDYQEQYDFRLDTLSPAKDVGDIDDAILVPVDYDGNPRTVDAGPDLGAFERVE